MLWFYTSPQVKSGANEYCKKKIQRLYYDHSVFIIVVLFITV